MEKKVESVSRQVEILKKYFPVDETEKTFTIKFNYDKATDMLDFSVGEEHCECFSNDVLKHISTVTNRIPLGYKANVEIVVDDYCDYNPEDLINKLSDMIEINNYQIIRGKKKNFVLAAILVTVGFALLALLGVAKVYNWFGAETVTKIVETIDSTGKTVTEEVTVANSPSIVIRKRVIEEMLDITSWVFIWQAVTVVFLTPSSLFSIGGVLFAKIKSFSLKDKNDNLLVSKTPQDLYERWGTVSNNIYVRNILLLITSTFMLCMGIYYVTSDAESIVSSIMKFVENAPTVYQIVLLILTFAFSFLGNLMIFLCGLFAIQAYRGARTHVRFLKVFSVLLFLTVLIRLIIYIQTKSVSDIFPSVIMFIVQTIFMVCVFGFKRQKKEKKPSVKDGE